MKGFVVLCPLRFPSCLPPAFLLPKPFSQDTGSETSQTPLNALGTVSQQGVRVGLSGDIFGSYMEQGCGCATDI